MSLLGEGGVSQKLTKRDNVGGYSLFSQPIGMPIMSGNFLEGGGQAKK